MPIDSLTFFSTDRPEIALSGASKLASTYFTLFYRSVHVLHTEIKAVNNHRENSPNRGESHRHRSVAMRPPAFERTLSKTV